MIYKTLKHKTKEGVYAKSEWDSMGGFELRESDTPYLYPEKFTKEFYKPVHDLSEYDLVEVQIKEIEKSVVEIISEAAKNHPEDKNYWESISRIYLGIASEDDHKIAGDAFSKAYIENRQLFGDSLTPAINPRYPSYRDRDISNMEAVSKELYSPWIPVTESLPGIGKLVEVRISETIMEKASLYIDDMTAWRGLKDSFWSFNQFQSWREIQEDE